MSNLIKRKTTNLPSLHALRGLSAVMVVIYHFDAIAVKLNFTYGNAIIHKGYLMVDLFFILSGFIMLHVYRDFFSNQQKVKHYLRFLKARFARIYPLHLFTLVVLMILFYFSLNSYMLGDLSDSIYDPAAIPSHLLLLQSFGFQNIFTWNITSWSISAEWFAYLIFPVLAILLNKNRKYTYVGMVVVVISCYVAIVYYLPRSTFLGKIPNPNNLNVSYDWGFLRGLAGFMSGMIVYHFYLNKNLSRFLAKDIFGITSIIVLISALSMRMNDLIYIPLFMILLLCLVSNNGILHKICTLKPLQFIGKISYSIYMLHYILILCVLIPALHLFKFKYTGPGSLHPQINIGLSLCVMFLIVVVLFSSVCYDLIEKPCRNWINNKRQSKM